MPSAASAKSAKSTIQCFKPGRHLALNGAMLGFAESDLAATASAYNPALHQAPLVVGHPKLDGPAYGWVSALAFAAGALEATPEQVNPEFAALVNDGAYKKISAAFWAPDAPGNPVPGVYYLRHVGFLGATAPAVKGLRTPQFAGGEAGIVEFSEWDDVDNASLWRGLRDWLLGKFGQSDADTAIPPYLVASVERGAQQELAATRAAPDDTTNALAPAFAARAAGLITQPTESTAVTPQEKTALEAENAALRQQLADAAAANRQARLDNAHSDAVAFADSLVEQGRRAPAHRDLIVTTLDAIAAQAEADGAVVQFGQGEARAPLLPALKQMLAALPPLVAAGQLATNDRAAAGAADDGVAFAAPPGSIVRPERTALLVKAKAYMSTHPGCDFAAACRAVGA